MKAISFFLMLAFCISISSCQSGNSTKSNLAITTEPTTESINQVSTIMDDPHEDCDCSLDLIEIQEKTNEETMCVECQSPNP